MYISLTHQIIYSKAKIHSTSSDRIRSLWPIFQHGLLIALMKEAARTSETSIYFNKTTWRYIPEGCNLQIKDISTSIKTYRNESGNIKPIV
jgi:hypothetical protein